MITIRTNPGPFQVMFLIAAILGGVGLAVAGNHLGSTLARVLPGWVTWMLAAGLVSGSVVALIGMSVQRLVGLLAEQVGMAELAVLFLVYSGFTFEYVGPRGFVTVIFFLAFAAACTWRLVQIVRDVKKARQVIHEALEAQSRRGSP